MNDSIQTRKRTLQNLSIGIVCTALLLATYFTTGNYVSREIRTRDEKISDLNNQVNSLQNLLEEQKPRAEDLTRQIRNLTGVVKTLQTENEELAGEVHQKQYQLLLAWHEIYVLRNQTEKLKGQIAELERQNEVLRATPPPTGVP
jgi:chromosome segregation ATPase